MSDAPHLFVGAVPPEDRRREPLHGTRLFAVLASDWDDAATLIAGRSGRAAVDVARRDDAPTRLYAGRLPLRVRDPVEFSLDERG